MSTKLWKSGQRRRGRRKWDDGGQMSVSPLRERRHEEDEDKKRLWGRKVRAAGRRADVREVCSLLSVPDDVSLLSSCVGDRSQWRSSGSRKERYSLLAGIMVPHFHDTLLSWCSHFSSSTTSVILKVELFLLLTVSKWLFWSSRKPFLSNQYEPLIILHCWLAWKWNSVRVGCAGDWTCQGLNSVDHVMRKCTKNETYKTVFFSVTLSSFALWLMNATDTICVSWAVNSVWRSSFVQVMYKLILTI